MGVIVKAFQPAEERRILARRDRRLACQPGKDIVIGKLHYLFEAAQTVVVELLYRGIREASQQKVHFANAAVPRTKTQPPPADLWIGMHDTLAKPSEPARSSTSQAGGPYIATAAAPVIVAGRQCWMAAS